MERKSHLAIMPLYTLQLRVSFHSPPMILSSFFFLLSSFFFLLSSFFFLLSMPGPDELGYNPPQQCPTQTQSYSPVELAA